MKSESVSVDFENSIGPWLGRTMKIIDYHMQEVFEEANLDLTKEQMIVLKKLHETDGLNQNELAILTFRDKSSLARLLSKMEQKKYIVRNQDKFDKRVNNVFLTKHGKDVHSRSLPIIKGLIDRIEKNISVLEKKEMIALLKKVQGNLK
mgnify:CR=1 FL=1